MPVHLLQFNYPNITEMVTGRIHEKDPFNFGLNEITNTTTNNVTRYFQAYRTVDTAFFNVLTSRTLAPAGPSACSSSDVILSGLCLMGSHL